MRVFIWFHTQLIHLWTTMHTMFRQKAKYKNHKTGTSLIRESEAAQADSLYHISRTQYTRLSVRYIFHIYTPWQIKKIRPLCSLLSHLCTPNGKWIQSNGDVHVCKHWNCTEELLSPLHFLSVRYFDKLYNRSGVIMRIGWLVGPRKAHITSLWRYGGKQPPSGECHPSSNGLSDQDRQLHQARHIWPWHWSCKLLSQELMEPHNMP